MENKQEKSHILENLWANWCNLNPDTRDQVASQLGPFGRVLNIAANVQQLVQTPNSVGNEDMSHNSQKPMFEEDDDIIEAEFEEVG